MLRLVPSRISIPSKGSAAVTVYAIRKDGFDGPIKLSFKDLPDGLQSTGATLAAKQEAATLTLKTSLTAMEKPINLTVVGTAKVGDREIVHEAVPAEDKNAGVPLSPSVACRHLGGSGFRSILPATRQSRSCADP